MPGVKDSEEIAPCGMNCFLCIGFQRKRRPCPGCHGPDENKPKHCVVCKIKNCEELARGGNGFCYSCGRFPCKRLKQLDTRYRTKYGMSMIENLQDIKAHGIEEFKKAQMIKWMCRKCGSLLCVHRDGCQSCGEVNEGYETITN